MEFCNSDRQSLSDFDNKKQLPFLSDVLPKTKYDKKDKSWDTHKIFCGHVSVPMLASEKLSHQKQGKRIAECSQTLEFGWVLVSTDTGEAKLRLKSARFCRVRHCPICQWRRALMWVSRFYDAFPRIYEAHPKMRYIMLTLTVRNCAISELRSTVTQMSQAWKRLTKRKDYPALGFVRSLEVTPEKNLYLNSKGEKSDKPKEGFQLVRKGRPDYCHPHFHILLAVPPSYFNGRSYLSKNAWAALWQDAMRLDYKPVCDVRIVKEKAKKGQIFDGATVPESTLKPLVGLMSAITETIKYTTKPADMVKDSAWLLTMVDEMQNIRAVALGGIFKEFLKETETAQDLIAASEPDIEKVVKNEGGFLFDWRKQVKQYQYVKKKDFVAVPVPVVPIVENNCSPNVPIALSENLVCSDLADELRAVVNSGKSVKEFLELKKKPYVPKPVKTSKISTNALSRAKFERELAEIQQIDLARKETVPNELVDDFVFVYTEEFVENDGYVFSDNEPEFIDDYD